MHTLKQIQWYASSVLIVIYLWPLLSTPLFHSVYLTEITHLYLTWHQMTEELPARFPLFGDIKNKIDKNWRHSLCYRLIFKEIFQRINWITKYLDRFKRKIFFLKVALILISIHPHVYTYIYKNIIISLYK